MDLSLPGFTNAPLSTAAVFADNVQDLLGAGTLQVHPSATIVVNSIDDALNSSPSVITLRDAINQANADTGEDLIVFDRSLFTTAQTITLKLGELDITHNLDIIAPRDPLTGGDLVTVSGNKASRVFEIGEGATVTLSGLIIANGQVARDNGGGILNSGTLTLDSSIVSNNSIFNPFLNPAAGGGIYNTGTLEVSNSTISGNSGAAGGGIYNQGTLTVSNTTLSSNSASTKFTAGGGGIFNRGTAWVINSTFNNNKVGANAGADGGGILNVGILQVSNSTLNNNLASANAGGFGGGISNDGGTLEVSNSTLSGNSAGDFGGGIYNGSGISIVSNSTLSGNSASEGGGIYNNLSTTITVSNSTLSGNSASGKSTFGLPNIGGGISNFGTITVSNSTLSGNSASGSSTSNSTFGLPNSGGGIYNRGTLTLVFSTLSLNKAANGSGVYNDPGSAMISPGTASARNTIIASNLLSENGINPDVSADFTSNGYNLIGDGTGSNGFGVTGDIVGTSENPIDPRLDVLAFNGGFTKTFALLPDSPAIGAADPTVLDTDPTTDQRGLPPRRSSDGRADIGAYEFS